MENEPGMPSDAKDEMRSAFRRVAMYFFTPIALGLLFGLFNPVLLFLVLGGTAAYGGLGVLLAIILGIAQKPLIWKPLLIYSLLTLVIGFGACTLTFMTLMNVH